ncbi:AMP-binding protein [Saxibacter everestensis]|uniref:AMP-binding protein n=1 Tax=Saxibacter everestensis TaxID=2909229 RepID=A0ABY8QUY0_9MICO|nr:AMP-binding protein [Brevibacteriaceae bacterium ZFBP1038]
MTEQPLTFDQVWKNTVSQHGERIFLLFHQVESANADTDAAVGGDRFWSYAEFDRIVDRVVASLTARGVQPGTSIHLALRNSPAFVAVWLAAAKLGAWIVPVDPASSARDIASQISRTRPKVGIYAAERGEVYREGAIEQLANLIELTETAADVEDGSALTSGTDAGGAGVEDSAVSTQSSRSVPSDRLAVMFTSGTTSAPKGVVLTQANYASVSSAMSTIIDLQPEDRWLVTLPLFHANAQYYCFAPAIAVGASVALTSTFSASRWCQQAHDLAATHASLFAAPIRMILARRPADAPRLQLRHLWFAQSLAESHFREFTDYIGCRPRQLYGMTETVAIVTADMSEAPRHDVIGTPIPGREVAVVDPWTFEPVPQGEPGLLALHGVPGGDIFTGYLDDPGTTENAFRTVDRKRWFKTGDLVSVMDDGSFRFVGRIDDVIKVAGENVSLTEVEAALSGAPGVLEVAVLAQPDPIRDQVPIAYVVARDPDHAPDAGQLAAWADSNLAPAARPREWHLISELPRTSVGKVRRFKLRDDKP